MNIVFDDKKGNVAIPIVNQYGEVTGWQQRYYVPLAHPSVGEISPFYYNGRRITNEIVFASPEQGESEERFEFDEEFIGKTHQYSIGGQKVNIQFNRVWGSSIKKGTLTGVTPKLGDHLQNIFTYSESSVRVASAMMTNGWTGGYVEGMKLRIVPVNTKYGMFFVGDGANYVRKSIADKFREKLVIRPYEMESWKFGVQSLQQIIRMDDQIAVYKELLPYMAQAINVINNNLPLDKDQLFVQETEKLELMDELVQRLIEADPMMARHPVIAAILSKNRAGMVYEALTTGAARTTMGFVAMPMFGERGGIVLPPKEVAPKYYGSDWNTFYTGIRFPGDSPFANLVLHEDLSMVHGTKMQDYLATAEGFQNRFVWQVNGQPITNMSKGMTYIVPDHMWPWGDADYVISSDDIKASSGWSSSEDIDTTRSTFGTFEVDGIFTAINWVASGNIVAIDADTWKQAGGDFDGDMGGLRPADKHPAFTKAVINSLKDAKGKITKAKLPKVYTFGERDRTKSALDSIQGGLLVGMWSNIATVIAHTHPKHLPDIYELLNVRAQHDFFVEAGVLKEVDYDEEDALYWVLQSIISLGIQAGTDGFKTNLDKLGGMEFLSRLASTWSMLLKDANFTTPVLTFNPKRNGVAFRDNHHLPTPEKEPYGIASMLMSTGVTHLELPDYFDVGMPSESFKYWAMMPKSLADLDAAKHLRTLCRKELARRNMSDPAQWVVFVEKFWKPMVIMALEHGVIADRWEPVNELDPKSKYRPVNPKKVPSLIGADKYYLANLLWFVFHDVRNSAKGNAAVINSLSPVIWLFPDEVVRIIKEKPGIKHLQESFEVRITDSKKPKPGTYTGSIRYFVVEEEVEGVKFASERAVLLIDKKEYLLDKDTPAYDFASVVATVHEGGVRVTIKQIV